MAWERQPITNEDLCEIDRALNEAQHLLDPANDAIEISEVRHILGRAWHALHTFDGPGNPVRKRTP